MNIFYLDRDPKFAAEYHCDKHIVKMIIEYAQLLSAAHHIHQSSQEIIDKIYKKTHVNHPSVIWTASSLEHYNWLYKLFLEVNYEYTKRYNKIHKTYEKLAGILKTPPKNLKSNGFIDPPKAMPKYCKVKDVVESYRNYYNLEKSKIAKWKNGNIPFWFKRIIN